MNSKTFGSPNLPGHDGGKEPANPSSSPEGRLQQLSIPSRPAGLADVPLADLCSELLARIRDGEFVANEAGILCGCKIQTSLQSALDVHCNRVSRKRYQDLFSCFIHHTLAVHPRIEGATVVDLGCGSANPFGLLFLFLMLGAKRGVAIDLDPIQDMYGATKAMADCAAMMLIHPEQLVNEYPITREQVLRNVASFDLAKLNAGDPSGIDPHRLSYHREPMNALLLRDGEADIVMSNAVLEHLCAVGDAIAEMARVTRKGGIGVHTIDGSDHRRYTNSACSPLEFLTVADKSDLVYGSNRIRPVEFCPMFERHGFEVIRFTPFETAEIDTPTRNQFVEPFRSMSIETLRVTIGNLVVRRL